MKKSILCLSSILLVGCIGAHSAIEQLPSVSSNENSSVKTTFNGMTVRRVFSDVRVAKMVDAVSHGDFKEADKQLAAGVDVNAIGEDGLTPLLWMMNAAQVVSKLEYLLKAGANPNYKAKNHDISAMSWAAGVLNPTILELLLKYNGDPNLLGPEDEPLLFIAASEQLKNNVALLIKKGADVNIHDSINDTAADKAAYSGNFEMVAYLLDNGLTYNLQGLAKSVDASVAGPKGRIWKDKVIEMLKARGAKFPAFDRKHPNDPTPWNKND